MGSNDISSEAAGGAALIFSRFDMCSCVVAATALEEELGWSAAQCEQQHWRILTDCDLAAAGGGSTSTGGFFQRYDLTCCCMMIAVAAGGLTDSGISSSDGVETAPA